MDALLRWYAEEARDLPWRGASATPWGVLVSEVMLQQTPVSRVEPVWRRWISRWPEPGDLAAEPAGEAVRAWGRLGYPRRALRLHAAATACVRRHAGAVPSDPDALRALPGVGAYTAAAVASFAFAARVPVLDTNVRRVLARMDQGRAGPGPAAPTRAEVDRATTLLPAASAAAWNVALMELGALVCTARSPRCHGCPVAAWCRWRLAEFPAYDGPSRRAQAYEGTDRQARGRILALLREASGPVHERELLAGWDDPVEGRRAAQARRALGGLIADGLAVPAGADAYALPG